MAERAKNGNGRTRSAGPEKGRTARRLKGVARRVMDRFVANDPLTAVLLLLGVALLVYLPERGVSYGGVQVGEVARRDYRAPFTVPLEDESQLHDRRREAWQSYPPVYRRNPAAGTDGQDKIRRFFRAGREFLAAHQGGAGAGRTLSPEERAALAGALPWPVDEALLDLFHAQGFSAELEATLLRVYRRVMREKIAPSPPILEKARQILILAADGSEERFPDVDAILDLESAKARVPEILREESAAPGGRTASLVGFLQPLVNPNLDPDPAETAARRQREVAAVLPATVPRGRVIVRSGDLLTEEAVAILERIDSRRTVGRAYRLAAGALVIVGLLVFFLRRYIRVHQREFKDRRSLFGMNMVVALGMAGLTVVFLWLGTVLAQTVGRAPFDQVLPYRFAIPVAAGALLMVLLTNARMAMVFSILMSVLFGVLAGWDLTLSVHALIGSFAAIYGFTQYKERSAILKAGLVVGAVNVATIIALGAVAEHPPSLSEILFQSGAGLAGGVLVAITASFTLPVLESLFGVVTDIRLLELSNLNSPLLRKLSVEAPGTYNHSVIVGTLAEAAAEAIGVGALLCRVAAYYHDIGKMKKPEYFIENSPDARTRHAKLSPTMSSLIILSHVKDGAKMARDYNLPKPIEDFILQHHGTRLITYFFKKAKKMEDREIQEVSESNFRYPGPRPQTKEAAIFMMADSVEAAARTVDEPTPAKFQDLIRKIVNAVVLDDQLSETDLTFSDLDGIQKSFEKTLASIYHHRIEYPGFRFEDRPGRDRITLPA